MFNYLKQFIAISGVRGPKKLLNSHIMTFLGYFALFPAIFFTYFPLPRTWKWTQSAVKLFWYVKFDYWPQFIAIRGAEDQNQ